MEPTEPVLSDSLSDELPQHHFFSVQLRAVLLLIFMALILLGAAGYLMWARGAFEVTQPLYLVTDDSDGVAVGMDMTFSGFPIGRVRRTELAEGGTVRVSVDVPVKDARWLRNSSVFTLERGLVGSARLRAFTGMMDDAPLPSGAERPLLRGDVSAEIPKMVADAREVLQNVNQLTGENAPLSRSLKELQTFGTRLNNPGEGGLLTTLTGDAGDARAVGELLASVNRLIKRLDTVAVDAQKQWLGKASLTTDTQASMRELRTMLQAAQTSLKEVDAVLKEVKGVVANTRAATDDLDVLRDQVDSSLRKADSMMGELSGKWPFAPTGKDIDLP